MNTTLLQILKKATADQTSLRRVEPDTRHIERLKNRVEEWKIRAGGDIKKALLSQNMKEDSKFRKLGLNNSHTPH